MKQMWKYILYGLGTVLLMWVFLSLVHAYLDGINEAARIAAGVGFFLAFEMVVCTGAVLCRIDRHKEHTGAEAEKKESAKME